MDKRKGVKFQNLPHPVMARKRKEKIKNALGTEGKNNMLNPEVIVDILSKLPDIEAMYNKYKTPYDRAVAMKNFRIPTFNNKVLRKMREEAMKEQPKEKPSLEFMEPTFLLEMTKETTKAFKGVKDRYALMSKELFINEFSIQLKRSETLKLQQIELEQDSQVTQEEEDLEYHANYFAEYIKTSDRICADAKAESIKETKRRLEKIYEIKTLQSMASALNNNIHSLEDALYGLVTLEEFLDNLAPPSWRREKQETLRQERLNANEAELQILRNLKDDKDMKSSEETINLEVYIENPNLTTPAVIYFTRPEQLTELLADLEETNLTLINHLQGTMDALEAATTIYNATEEKLKKETDVLKEQYYAMEASIKAEEEKSNNLNQMIRAYQLHSEKEEAKANETSLDEINIYVADLYNTCVGGGATNLNTIMMLTAVEQYLEELEDRKATIQPPVLERFYKNMIRRRLMHQRQREKEEKQRQQEERFRKIMLMYEVREKKKPTRKLMYRSAPPVLKVKKKVSGRSKQSMENEELMKYFFS